MIYFPGDARHANAMFSGQYANFNVDPRTSNILSQVHGKYQKQIQATVL